MFERCLPPIIPSATTADSKDSIPASIAIVKAGWIRVEIVFKSSTGIVGIGRAEEISPNLAPIVSTSILKIKVIDVIVKIALIEPGSFCPILGILGQIIIIAIESKPKRKLLRLIVFMCAI